MLVSAHCQRVGSLRSIASGTGCLDGIRYSVTIATHGSRSTSTGLKQCREQSLLAPLSRTRKFTAKVVHVFVNGALAVNNGACVWFTHWLGAGSGPIPIDSKSGDAEARSTEACMRSHSGANRSRGAPAKVLGRRNGGSRGTRFPKSALAGMPCVATAHQGCLRSQGDLSPPSPFFSSLQGSGNLRCGLNPIMIANAGAGHGHAPGSIRSRPCTDLWRNGSPAGRNRGKQMRRCAAACGVVHAAVGRDGGGPAGSGPYRPDHGCVGPAAAPRGCIPDLSKGDGWPHDHPIYRSHTRRAIGRTSQSPANIHPAIQMWKRLQSRMPSASAIEPSHRAGMSTELELNTCSA